MCNISKFLIESFSLTMQLLFLSVPVFGHFVTIKRFSSVFSGFFSVHFLFWVYLFFSFQTMMDVCQRISNVLVQNGHLVDVATVRQYALSI